VKPRWLNPREQAAWRPFLGVIVLLFDRLDKDLQRGAGLSHAAYAILSNLSEAPGRALRMSQLASIMWSSRSRLTYLVDQLQKSGWVRREPFAGDGRGAVAVLTDEGLAVLEQAAPVHVESVRASIFDHLSPHQVEQLRDISQTLLPHLAVPGASDLIDAIVHGSSMSRQEHGAQGNGAPTAEQTEKHDA
jgi:DNA-binding MarR family transcriptional regulator